MHVRIAVLADLERLLPLVQAYRVFYGRSPMPGEERAYLHAHLTNRISVIFIAETDDAAVGFAQLFKTYNTVRLQPAYVLEDLFVDPAGRRSGVASALLDRCVQHAEEAGATVMFLETAHDNAAAQALYERSGWKRETDFVKYNAPLE